MMDAKTFKRIDKQLRDAIDLIIRSTRSKHAMHAIRVINQARADLARLKRLVLLPHSDDGASDGASNEPA